MHLVPSERATVTAGLLALRRIFLAVILDIVDIFKRFDDSVELCWLFVLCSDCVMMTDGSLPIR